MARPSRWTEVVEASALVFRRRGFAQASLEEIAEELGMWKGSLYNYINTKEDLLTAVVDLDRTPTLEPLNQRTHSSFTPEDRIR